MRVGIVRRRDRFDLCAPRRSARATARVAERNAKKKRRKKRQEQVGFNAQAITFSRRSLRCFRRKSATWEYMLGSVREGDDRSVKINSLEADKIMKIKWLVLGCIEADFCK